MSQFGMQMPGGRSARKAGPDVYTALMFVGTMALLVAAVVLGVAAAKVSPDGNPLSVREASSTSTRGR